MKMRRGINLYKKNESEAELNYAKAKKVAYEKELNAKFPTALSSFFVDYFPFRHSFDMSSQRIDGFWDETSPDYLLNNWIVFCRLTEPFFAHIFNFYLEEEYENYGIGGCEMFKTDYGLDTFLIGDAEGGHQWHIGVCLSGAYQDKVILMKLGLLEDYHEELHRGMDQYKRSKAGILVLANDIYEFVDNLAFGTFKLTDEVEQIR